MTAEDNRTIVQKALAGLVETGDVAALGAFLSDDFVHHRPGPTTRSKAEWLAAVGTAMVALAGMRIEIHHLLADGDRVALHSRRWLPDGGPEIAVVDVWRIGADGLIAEGWEIIEPVARAADNFEWWT
ncbi:nuclear transport factor 2 family protein [Virgisporangium aurantiacum]|uniref:nuclear transport factor 2 family protein n=1 Tax=Virgisporangium aurantiacum TaxID=175570 RepID=UPI001EF2CA43|nr:nuclear transport factor 2 family protein [Virgisporangium aurantiacum]